MKILIVTGIFPPDHGGPASYVPAIAEALSNRHLIISVVTLSDRSEFQDSEYKFPVKRILRKSNKLIRAFKTIYTIRKTAREADIIFVNGLIFESILACKIFLNKPVIVKIVGDLIWEKARLSKPNIVNLDEFQNGYYGIRLSFLKWIYRKFINQCDAVIVPSQYLYKIVKGWNVDIDKINVIYNSVKPPTTEINNIAEDSKVDCVTVARLVPWKGIGELIDVVCENKWTLNIIGDGPLKNELVNRVNDHDTTLVKFLGYVPHEKVLSEISKSKVFILNSIYEGLPHIVLEAKLAGVAVVATAVGGTPETIEDGIDGYLVAPGEKANLAEKIRRLLSNDFEREKIALKGKAQVMENFSYEKMVMQTEEVLNNVFIKTAG